MSTSSSKYRAKTQPETQASDPLQQASTISFQPASHLFISLNQQLFIESLLCASAKNVPRLQEKLKSIVWDFTSVEKHNVTMFLKTRNKAKYQDNKYKCFQFPYEKLKTFRFSEQENPEHHDLKK